MATKQGTLQPIVIPTGYESDYRKAQSRQELAKALQAKALGGQGQMQSWLQPLSQIGQAFLAKRLLNKADSKLQEIDDRVRDDYTTQSAEFDADAKVLSPADMIAKWSLNPLMAERVKPFQDAYTTGLKDRQELVKDGPYWRRKSDIKSGDLQANDLNNGVIYGADGGGIVNPLAVTAAQAKQGFPITGGTYQMADPRAGGQQQPPPLPPVVAPGMPAGTTADGRPAWFINGQWFDNPEGN